MNGELIASGLHFEKAMFVRRYRFEKQEQSIVEHRVYISRTLKGVMVLEFDLVSPLTSKSIEFSYLSTFDPLNQTHNPETECVGGGGVEIDVEFTFNSDLSTSSMFVYEGVLLSQDDRNRSLYVTICTQQPADTLQILTLSSSEPKIQFLSSLSSSIDFGPDSIDQSTVTLEAINRFDEALNKRHVLFDEHVQAWKDLWKSGIDIQPSDDQPFAPSNLIFDADHNGQNDTIITIFSRSLDIAQHVNSSMYYLLSSSRDDWP